MTSQMSSCYSQAGWMYSDPYAYQYADIEPENDLVVVSRGQQGVSTSGKLYELEGSSPTDATRYELPADPPHNSHRTTNKPTTSPSRRGRNRSPSAHSGHKYSERREHISSTTAYATSTPYAPRRCPSQPPSAGLIPVLECDPIAAQSYASGTVVQDTALHHQYARPNTTYIDGLIPVDDNASTPKESSSDFDAILRNIGPVSKKGKGKTGRERSSRYYDRYSSNFG